MYLLLIWELSIMKHLWNISVISTLLVIIEGIKNLGSLVYSGCNRGYITSQFIKVAFLMHCLVWFSWKPNPIILIHEKGLVQCLRIPDRQPVWPGDLARKKQPKQTRNHTVFPLLSYTLSLHQQPLSTPSFLHQVIFLYLHHCHLTLNCYHFSWSTAVFFVDWSPYFFSWPSCSPSLAIPHRAAKGNSWYVNQIISLWSSKPHRPYYHTQNKIQRPCSDPHHLSTTSSSSFSFFPPDLFLFSHSGFLFMDLLPYKASGFFPSFHWFLINLEVNLWSISSKTMTIHI